MSTRATAALLVTAFLVVIGATLFLGGGRASAAPLGATDLAIGPTYIVADFRACTLANGTPATEWHFGGATRSLRNQLTPRFDGRGRRILRVVKNDSSLPVGHMRLRMVTEADPTLEGFAFGTYSWTGIVVEYNGRVERQGVVGPCGPAR